MVAVLTMRYDEERYCKVFYMNGYQDCKIFPLSIMVCQSFLADFHLTNSSERRWIR